MTGATDLSLATPRRSRAMRLLAALLAAIACSAAPAVDQEAIRPFNGSTLDGWEGDLTRWSVRDGAIVGKSDASAPLAESAYLVWKGDMPRDFDLRCQVWIDGGNGGIHYRSRRVEGKADLAGFQADLDADNAYTGILYEGLGRGIMSSRGEEVEWTPEGKRVLRKFGDDAALRGVMRPREWNDYRIEARGTRIRHWINGQLMTDVTDGDASRFRSDGALALQLHSGPPMETRVRQIEVRPIAEAPQASSISVPLGFAVELVASARPGNGSWVCIAFDRSGRAIISPQSGPLLRVSIPGVSREAGDSVRIEPLEGAPRSAQGLCVAGDSLWVNSSEAGPECGLWRLLDADGDGRYEERTRVIAWDGDGGEHGPHGVISGPDGAIYVAVGNHTPLPSSLLAPTGAPGGRRTIASPCDFWDEDIVGTRMWDPIGHAVGILAPGGTVLRLAPDGLSAEVFATGFRNHYDLAFNRDGELFTYDSDMEWDIGAPWYRAPRIVHVVRGGEYGWRSGSGKWPEWSPDSLPPACDTDVASPTGMLSGHDGGFPAPWRDALFAADWTYGRILAVTLDPDGASYRGSWSVFASGRPMPVADMAWGPDGAMYVVTGGRGTQSGLYRIAAAAAGTDGAVATAAHAAPSSGAAAAPRAPRSGAATARAVRRRLESRMDQSATGSDELALESLGSDDRWIAFAARTALEHQGSRPLSSALSGGTSRERAMAALALARIGSPQAARSTRVREALLAGLGSPDPWTRLIALRAVGVMLSRTRSNAAGSATSPAAGSATPPAEVSWIEPIRGRVTELIHDQDPRCAEMALAIGCALDWPAARDVALARLDASSTRADRIRLASVMRTCAQGWTDDARARYWRALDGIGSEAGGFSLQGFVDRIRKDAQERVGRPAGAAPESAGSAPAQLAASAPRTGAPGAAATVHAWTADELLAGELDGGDAARGAAAFRDSMCSQCHRFGGEGGGHGPDLTGLAGRFTRRDMLVAILEPSAHVSDQWRDTALTLDDGSMVVGRIVSIDGDSLTVATNPLGPDTEQVPMSRVTRRESVATSSMPRGLLDPRSRQEISDLLAYLESGIATPAQGAASPKRD